MQVIAVIGPFRAETAWAIEQHCRAAEAMALKVWRLGAAVICPHMNTRGFHGVLPDEVWLEGYLEILRRCDAAIVVEGWEHSAGSCREVAEAERWGITVFETLDELEHWIRTKRS